ncbi:acyl-CoA dehydrogenase family protein [Desertimonas flava]|uniref:acyl-CoA dehydrogenase family protein n=1 Tax=Desertimonas flava TaxID=2064846 RepID=UPI000E352213|nr:acyl-CoA dehydrogenase family protein [Desertimonas flava]
MTHLDTAPTTTASESELVDERIDQLLAECPPASTDRRTFLGAQFDLGLAWVDHPVGLGGLGVSARLQNVVLQRLYEAGAPSARLRNAIGIGHAAPTIVHHGTPAQQQLLRPMFTGEELWCQLFSEPGAGSDLANVSTRAVRDGSQWIVNGQKVWTSLAHVSDRAMLLTRTDPDQPKHRGLTYFLIDMHQPGIEVRPLRQLTGDAEFNEVFLNDLVLSDDDRIGDVNDGWRVATTTLTHERDANAATIAPRGSGAIGEAMRLYGRRGRPGGETRARLVTCWIDAEVNRLTSMRVAANRQRGSVGPEGSIGKLASSLVNQRIMNLCADLLGTEALLYASYEMPRVGAHDAGAVAAAGWLADSFEASDDPSVLTDDQLRHAYLRSVANQIEAGSSQIMRNIIGERVLGLPGEPRVDKHVAWGQQPGSS